ncbi:hypothetical protein Glove_8g31 [Diversispora epigaea]|uniref:Uncharacterized protein n=1 Tax=Diversispora epigaea TaxID=1348612 RepID=A0A397JR06_9GLOM|nr:hypothetical protein Glove_8g31 [Diversispora epigaea]
MNQNSEIVDLQIRIEIYSEVMKNSPSGRRIQVGKRIKKKKRNVQFRIRFPELRRKEEREIPMTTVYSNSRNILRNILYMTDRRLLERT